MYRGRSRGVVLLLHRRGFGTSVMPEGVRSNVTLAGLGSPCDSDVMPEGARSVGPTAVLRRSCCVCPKGTEQVLWVRPREDCLASSARAFLYLLPVRLLDKPPIPPPRGSAASACDDLEHIAAWLQSHNNDRLVLQYDSAEWKLAFLRQAREFLIFPLLPREASKRVSIFENGTGSKPERLRSGSLQADLSLIV